MALLDWEYAFILALQSLSTQWLDALMIAFTFLGTAQFWFLVGAVLYWSGKERLSFHLMNLVLFTAAVVGAFKVVVDRPRPDPGIVNVVYTDASSTPAFPSGHTTLIAGMWGYFEKRLDLDHVTWMGIAVVLVGISRVYLGVHFLTDVIGGAIIGLFIGKTYFLLTQRLHRARFRLSKLREELALILALILALALLYAFEPMALIALFLGYYIGFFWFREMGVSITPVKGYQLVRKLFNGFIPLLAIVLFNSLKFNSWQGAGLLSSFLFFVAGVWVTLGYPILYERHLARTALRKTQRRGLRF